MNTRLLPRPGDLIGHRRDGRPIYLLAGGSQMTTEPDDGDEGGGADDDGDGDDDGGSKYTPPSRAEWLRTQAALVKANASAKARREALAAKESELKALQDEKAAREAEDERKKILNDAAKPKGKKGGGQPAPQPVLPEGVLTRAQVKQLAAEAAREAKESTAEAFRARIANQAARAELVGAGVPKTSVKRLVGLIDLDQIELDDDGEVVSGLDDQIASLKEDFPQLFATKEPEKKQQRRPPVTRATAAGRTDNQPPPQSSADKMAAQILGAR